MTKMRLISLGLLSYALHSDALAAADAAMAADAESAAAEEGAPGEGGGDDAAAGTLGPEGGLLGPEPELGAAKSKVVEL